MNPKKIEKWIVYYTNKERKKRKRKPSIGNYIYCIN